MKGKNRQERKGVRQERLLCWGWECETQGKENENEGKERSSSAKLKTTEGENFSLPSFRFSIEIENRKVLRIEDSITTLGKTQHQKVLKTALQHWEKLKGEKRVRRR